MPHTMSTFTPAKPHQFSGKHGPTEVESFVQSCDVHFKLTNTTDDFTRIYGAISYFEARSMAEKWIAGVLYRKPPVFMTSWKTFKAELMAVFGESNDEQANWITFTTLKQTTSVQDYATKFRVAVERLQVNDRHAKLQFRLGVKKEIREDLLGKEFGTLDDLVHAAVKVEESMQGKGAAGYIRPPEASTPAPGAIRPPQPLPAPSLPGPPLPGQLLPAPTPTSSLRPRLTPVERQHRRDNGLCLYCGKSKHHGLKNCPFRPPRPLILPTPDSVPQIGSAVSQAGSADSQAGSAASQAGSATDQAGSAGSRAGSAVSRAGSASDQAQDFDTAQSSAGESEWPLSVPGGF